MIRKILFLSMVLLAVKANLFGGCPSIDLLRSDRVKNSFNPQLINGQFFEVLFNDKAQFGSWKCQSFNRKIQTDGSFQEDFNYVASGKQTKFVMKYDVTKDVGVYSAHPTFEPFGLPATIVDFAKDGSWMILYKCQSAGFLKIIDSIEILSKTQDLSEAQSKEIQQNLARASLDKISLTVVDHSNCTYEF